MRQEELLELERVVRTLEESNLGISEKLNAANQADATTFTYALQSICYIERCVLCFVAIHF